VSPDAVVCGAGAAGLACARALSGLGITVLVVERQNAPADIAKGELLQPEAVRILDSWGALPALQAGGYVAVDRLTIRDRDGAALLTLDYAALPGPYRQILCTEYPALLRALAASLGPAVEVRRGAVVREALRDSHGRVTGVRLSEGGRTYDMPAMLVVAADGLSSRLRAQAGIRARRHPYNHHLLAFDVAGGQVASEICAYRTASGLRLLYPLPGGRCRLYVQVRSDEFRGGLGDLAGWCERLLADLPALTPLADALRSSLDHRQMLAVHRLRVPRLSTPGLALAGDSAHCVHPMAAQGVNSTLSDAETLASCLARAGYPPSGASPGSAGPERVDQALRRYHDARARRLDHIATVSHNAARMLTTTAGPGRLVGGLMMRRTAANPRLLHVTTGNLSGVSIKPLTTVDRLYQLGLLADPRAHGNTEQATTNRPR
jgi:2-polyprenyl-6-methoxyphenol hydroxylase-like FAD-dependent oxidoreductase